MGRFWCLMFTGIVEEIGTVTAIRKKDGCMRISLSAKLVTQDAQTGDSVSVDGACLTIVETGPAELSFDVMPQTWALTTLKSLTQGSLVNLERAMKADSRFGGHMVSGHVDTVGIIRSRKRVKGQEIVSISIKPEFLKNMILRGSVAVDGVSLTISGIRGGCVSIGLIPHTATATTLGKKTSGSRVNIETDMLAKMAGRQQA